MIYYDRIDVSKGIDVNITSEWKDCEVCHYWDFLDKGFKFQPNACNACHDILMLSMNLNDITILNVHSANYCCIIYRISKSEAINLKQNIVLSKKSEKL